MHILPYLLLITFYSGEFNKFPINKIDIINKSPYQGVALPLADAYETKRYDLGDFSPQIESFKKKFKKHIWPWVFFNRFVGFEEGKLSHSTLANKEEFRKIAGMDLFNESGALAEFFHVWKMALKIAKELGAPGIVVDYEPYNNYEVPNLDYLSQKLRRPREEVKDRLKAIGAELLDIADSENPQAVIWFLATDLGKTRPNIWGEREYRCTETYLVHGMLVRAKEKHSHIKIVSGGQSSLGYCFLSLEDLEQKMAKREKDFAPIIKEYPNLFLGGTLAPWPSSDLKKGWMLRDNCGKSNLTNITDFQPLVAKLLENYRYVWIYAAGAAGYDPYSEPSISDILFNK